MRADAIEFTPESMPQVSKAILDCRHQLSDVRAKVSSLQGRIDTRGWENRSSAAIDLLERSKHELAVTTERLEHTQHNLERRITASKDLAKSKPKSDPGFGFNLETVKKILDRTDKVMKAVEQFAEVKMHSMSHKVRRFIKLAKTFTKNIDSVLMRLRKLVLNAKFLRRFRLFRKIVKFIPGAPYVFGIGFFALDVVIFLSQGKSLAEAIQRAVINIGLDLATNALISAAVGLVALALAGATVLVTVAAIIGAVALATAAVVLVFKGDVISDFIYQHVVTPISQGLKWAGTQVTKAASSAWDHIKSGASSAKNIVQRVTTRVILDGWEPIPNAPAPARNYMSPTTVSAWGSIAAGATFA